MVVGIRIVVCRERLGQIHSLCCNSCTHSLLVSDTFLKRLHERGIIAAIHFLNFHDTSFLSLVSKLHLGVVGIQTGGQFINRFR